MNYHLRKGTLPNKSIIELPASKSIANRLLIAQALSNHQFEIQNLSAAKDTVLLQSELKSASNEINVGMAGTAYRFLTAYYAIAGQTKTLTGDARMKERPIGILVDQLRLMGANIQYLEKEGFPPLKITESKLKGGKIVIDGSISSQFISSLLLIAPYLKEGLKLELIHQAVSLPYIDMTIDLMLKLSINVKRMGKLIEVQKGNYQSKKPMVVEADWSSAAFFYQMVAHSGKKMILNGLSIDSVQGDKRCTDYFKKLGVSTKYTDEGVELNPIALENNRMKFEMVDCPDLIPSVAVTGSHLLDELTINGVATLRNKESNRVEALKIELRKTGTELIEIGKDEIVLKRVGSPESKLRFGVHNDHRMAMSLAPLVLEYDQLVIEDAEVVEKSFPEFWSQLSVTGIELNSI